MRHFIALYLLIVGTLAATSWAQDWLWQKYGEQHSTDDAAMSLVTADIRQRIADKPTAQWPGIVADVAAASGIDLELYANSDIAGNAMLRKLDGGEVAHMTSSSGTMWLLKRIDQAHVLAVGFPTHDRRERVLERLSAFVFYGLIALGLMLWIWPLSRDLRRLENAVSGFGDRNWTYRARIAPGSQVHRLAESFRRMATRIDGLISSHKDLSNAVSHEIRTPLARMKFEIELAQRAGSAEEMGRYLAHIHDDINAIDDLVRATLAYAVLDRAEMALNVGTHDFTQLLPALVDSVVTPLRPDIRLLCDVQRDQTAVECDAHLMETLLRNLLQNACRYARSRITLCFRADQSSNLLLVDDDGPGIPEQDQVRVFNSFVQLGPSEGYGLGLAIVKRIAQWHDGRVWVTRSNLGGASFSVAWPRKLPVRSPTPAAGPEENKRR